MLFSLVSFLGAFLLFALQPFATKAITPWFGGGSHVWLTCMVFSQAMLLAGYGYAHWLVTRLNPPLQARVHGCVMALALLTMGLTWSSSGKPWFPARDLASEGAPFLGVLVLLLKSYGLPFLVLSATSPIIQSWFHRRQPEASPYRLYAFSNAGSLGGLLAYPFLMEPFTGLQAQGWVMSLLFLGYVLGTAWVGRGIQGVLEPLETEGKRNPRELWGWLFLAFTSTVLLMAVTNVLTSEFMGIPLLWVAPLLLYLLTFILAFGGHLQKRGPWFRGSLYGFLLVAIWCYPLAARIKDPRWLISELLLALFLACLLCHGLLYELRPPARRLTAYYLTISAGGVAGGLVVVLAAPALFNRFYEGPIGLLLLAGACLLASRADRGRWRQMHWVSAAGLACAGLLQLRHEVRIPGKSYRDIFGMVQVGHISGGVLKVLIHGTTLHGIELMKEPLAKSVYYTDESGIGRTIAVARSRKPALNFGLLGLGVGTVLGYGLPGDSASVYEISPKIVTLAGPEAAEFTVFNASPAKPTLQLGDGRFLLEKEPATKQFDVLLIDTFTGGNVPWHLLTREAFQTYFQHLQPAGYVVLHVTNYLPLDRLVLANARSMGLAAAVIECPSAENQVRLTAFDRHSVFVVLCRTWEDLAVPGLLSPARALLAPHPMPVIPGDSGAQDLVRKIERGAAESQQMRPWTDDQSSISRLIFGR